MKDVDLKNLGTLRLCGVGALVALATWGVWAFCGGEFVPSNGSEPVFEGWRYGREDQKAASAALAAAGFDEWTWDADGRLLAPKNKRGEYQTALALAGAYPKAPSESRRDAIREMGAFESETKTRMRELDACAFQLEQTLERAEGIEYATVGVRARREQAGLTVKTVVTASIGVACREGRELDAELLSAITVAAKHQLGVEANENVSILDLKAGKSYFGSEKSVGNGNELALLVEKERVEKYWRDKLEKTFDYMGGARVSVAAELVVADPSADFETEIEGVLGNRESLEETRETIGLGGLRSLREPIDLDGLNGLSGFVGLGQLEGRGSFGGWSDGDLAGETSNVSRVESRQSSGVRLASAEVAKIGGSGETEKARSVGKRGGLEGLEGSGEIGKPRPLATWDGGAGNVRSGGAYARLGNPVATRSTTPARARNLADVGSATTQTARKSAEQGVLSVGATERRDDARRRVVPAGYQAEERTASTGEENARSEGKGGVEEIEESEESAGVGETGRTKETEETEEGGKALKSGDWKKTASSEKAAKLGKDGEGRGVGETGKVGEERVCFRIRALAVRIGTPRGYVRRVAQSLKAESDLETFATVDGTSDWNVFYRTTEQKIIAETKNVALLLLRPLAERNGWTESELARSVAVDVFADPNDFNERFGGVGETARDDASGAVEVIANFGRLADTSELVAEETTVDAEAPEVASSTETEAEIEEAPTDFGAVFKARVRRLDAKTKVGLGLAVFAAVMSTAIAARRRKAKGGENGEEDDVAFGEEKGKKDKKGKKGEKEKGRKEKRSVEEKTNGAKEPLEGEKKGKEGASKERKTTFAKDGQNEGDEKEAERRTVVGNLRIARLADDGEDGRSGENGEERGATAKTRERKAASEREGGFWKVATRRGNAGSNDGESGGGEKLWENDDFDELDDWDELDDDLLEIRSLIERERARVDDATAETRSGSRGETDGGVEFEGMKSGAARSGGDATRRREALDFVARDPERAAESLRRWLRPGA